MLRGTSRGALGRVAPLGLERLIFGLTGSLLLGVFLIRGYLGGVLVVELLAFVLIAGVLARVEGAGVVTTIGAVMIIGGGGGTLPV